MLSATQSQAKDVCVAAEQSASIHSILADSQLGWDKCFNHSPELFQAAVNRLSTLITLNDRESVDQLNAELDHLFIYIRGFSYYAERKAVDSQTWLALDKLLARLARMPVFYQQTDTGARLREHFLVTLYRFYYQKPLIEQLPQQLQVVVNILEQLNVTDTRSVLSEQVQYSQLELYRTLGFIAYEARANDELKVALLAKFELASKEQMTLLELTTAHFKQLTDNNWQLHHSLWVLAYFHQLLEEPQQQALDKTVQDFLFENIDVQPVAAKRNFSGIYLANSYRTLDDCQQTFVERCDIPAVEQVLPINHTCSDNLFIRATSLSQSQLMQACQLLLKQQDFFHQSLNTGQQAVANDFNDSLRVVIFDNYSDYNRYGQLTFNINTNNGGMYIEGTPSDSDNQATFYSFQAFWQKPEFSVWNLNHEYVHYLDGRFNKYGGFGHFPSHIVWWTEGLAEFIANEAHNPRAFKLLADTPAAKWPDLAKIFATTYPDGSDSVYRWSYLAHLFLFQHYPEKMRALAANLKIDFFDGYRRLLTDIEQQYSSEFKLWLIQQLARQQTLNVGNSVEAESAKGTVKKMNRYWYRSYLQPAHLPLTIRHNHLINVN
ncbi:hypothetical protein tinsulaeT_31880 [Thalassotalea insulae]|uniref:Microbial collagenase n=1 Tax=Thalassotalea insulae TaxID=2056778 RepID=A0ABQ6GV91_9GAMM|nr:hypothetical protein tinsulaeT_31880 [Thalassotalea insulae]